MRRKSGPLNQITDYLNYMIYFLLSVCFYLCDSLVWECLVLNWEFYFNFKFPTFVKCLVVIFITISQGKHFVIILVCQRSLGPRPHSISVNLNLRVNLKGDSCPLEGLIQTQQNLRKVHYCFEQWQNSRQEHTTSVLFPTTCITNFCTN